MGIGERHRLTQSRVSNSRHSVRQSAFLLWDGPSTGLGCRDFRGLPSVLVAWLGFVWREERFEMFDLLLQLDHLELTPDGQPLELL